jgi:hypothetical protein
MPSMQVKILVSFISYSHIIHQNAKYITKQPTEATMSKQTAVDWLMKEFYGELQYVPITRWDRVQDIFQRAKQMEQELLFEYWKGGQASEDEGGLSFDVYHNGNDE